MRRYLRFLGLEDNNTNIQIAWIGILLSIAATIMGWYKTPVGSLYVRLISMVLSYLVISLMAGAAFGKKRINLSFALFCAYMLPMLMYVISCLDAAIFHDKSIALYRGVISPMLGMSSDNFFLGLDITSHAMFIAVILFSLVCELTKSTKPERVGRLVHFETTADLSDEEREKVMRSMELFFENVHKNGGNIIQPLTEDNFPYDYSKTPVSKKLKFYLDYTILRRYDSYDKGHNRDHIEEVAEGVLELAVGRNVDCNMLYTAAIFHDLGLCEGRETHHISSARMLREDSFINEFFTSEQVETIAEAIEDHRASAKNPPRSIYGEILSSADRVIDPDKIILRSFYHSEKYHPELTLEGHIDRIYQHIVEKYGEGGYLRVPILTERNRQGLQRLREMITNEEAFKGCIRKVLSNK